MMTPGGKANMYPSSSANLNKETEDVVYFFTPAFFPLDNFSSHAITIWGKTFSTVEHAFQWKKFSEVRPDIAIRIIEAPSPHIVKIISDANKIHQPSSWHEQRVTVMTELIQAKVAQHEDFRDALYRTGRRRIVENSPEDIFWVLEKMETEKM